MAHEKLKIGRGASATCLKRMLHPTRKVSDEHVNFTSKCELSDLVVVREDDKLIKNVSKKRVVHHHEDFPNEEPRSIRRWTVVSSKGPGADFFVPENQEDDEDEEKEGNGPKEIDAPLAGGAQEDLLNFWRLAQVLATTVNLRRRTARALATLATTQQSANTRIGQETCLVRVLS